MRVSLGGPASLSDYLSRSGLLRSSLHNPGTSSNRDPTSVCLYGRGDPHLQKASLIGEGFSSPNAFVPYTWATRG
jgi:hypothetical protein